MANGRRVFGDVPAAPQADYGSGLGSAFADFVQGMRQERDKQREEAFRKARLGLAERQLTAEQESAAASRDLQREVLTSQQGFQAEQAQLRREHEARLQDLIGQVQRDVAAIRADPSVLEKADERVNAAARFVAAAALSGNTQTEAVAERAKALYGLNDAELNDAFARATLQARELQGEGVFGGFEGFQSPGLPALPGSTDPRLAELGQLQAQMTPEQRERAAEIYDDLIGDIDPNDANPFRQQPDFVEAALEAARLVLEQQQQSAPLPPRRPGERRGGERFRSLTGS